jgi:molecular chaperone DnaK
VAETPTRLPAARLAGLDAVIVLEVRDERDLIEHYGPAIASAGLFVQREVAASVGALVMVEFRRADRTLVTAVSARVIHARPAMAPGDKTAGVALELLDFDARGLAIVERLKQSAQPFAQPAVTRDELSASSAPDSRPVVGIDLGTTYSCIAVVKNGEPKVLATSEGHETVPSVVYVGTDGKVVAGYRAYAKMALEPGRCVYGAKRFLGRRFASKEVNAFGHFFNYELASAKSGFTAAKIDATVIPLELVAAHILKHLADGAAAGLGEPVVRAIITVPAYFGETQRQAVREAGRLAGLEVVRILNEPTAAAVAYGHGRALDRKILVYDFGGGTFDATVMRVQGDMMEVLATDGDPFLGGADIDDRLTEYALAIVERTQAKAARKDTVAVQRLRLAAETAKRELSDAQEAVISVPNLSVAGGAPFDVALPISRDLFERLVEDLVNRSLAIVQRVLDTAKVPGAALDDIVMVGGQSRSPIIRRLLTERFGKQPTRGTHPDHAIAIGAAIIGGARDAAKPIILKDMLAKSIRLGLRGGGTEVLLAAGSPIPSEKSFMTTAGQTQEYRITLLRGEGATAAENELLGEVVMPSSLSLVVAKTKAKVIVKVDADGLLTVSAEHPLTHRIEKVELALPEGVPEADGLDIVQITR